MDACRRVTCGGGEVVEEEMQVKTAMAQMEICWRLKYGLGSRTRGENGVRGTLRSRATSIFESSGVRPGHGQHRFPTIRADMLSFAAQLCPYSLSCVNLLCPLPCSCTSLLHDAFSNLHAGQVITHAVRAYCTPPPMPTPLPVSNLPHLLPATPPHLIAFLMP